MKNKFILITLIFFIIFSFFVPSSLASFNCSDYKSKNYSFPDLPNEVLNKYFFITEMGADSGIFRIYYVSNMPYYKETCSLNSSYGVDCINLGLVTEFYEFNANSSDFVWTKKTRASSILHFSGILKPSENYWYKMVYVNFDVLNFYSKEIVFKKSKLNAFIENRQQIETGKFDKVVINAADYTNEELYLLTYYYSENTDNPMDSLYPRKEIQLKLLNNYYVGTKNEKAIYEVPLSHTGISLKER